MNEEETVPADVAIALCAARLHYWKWEDDDDPLAGMMAAVQFAHLGYPLPTNLMNWITTSFASYLRSDDTLDKVFGVSQRKKQSLRTDVRNAQYVVEAKVLQRVFGVTVDEALYCLRCRLEAGNFHISDNTLKDIFDRDGAKVTSKAILDDLLNDPESGVSFSSVEQKKQILELYPPEVRQLLKNKLSP